MHYLKHCLNPKVIAGLAAVAVAVWMFAPGAFAAALPLLILAICPLSMVGMMYMMRGGGQGSGSGSSPSCHSRDATEQSAGETAKDEGDSRAIEALRAQVAELEARLATQPEASKIDSVAKGSASDRRPGPARPDYGSGVTRSGGRGRSVAARRQVALKGSSGTEAPSTANSTSSSSSSGEPSGTA